MSKEICLLNDSFPPVIDGVANVVVNYAKVLQQRGRPVSVVTPECPGSDDTAFPYPVLRYPSLDLRKQIGYTAGNPIVPAFQLELARRDIGLLHCHCPTISAILVRQLRKLINAPFVMTYHTKYDVDIANLIKPEFLQQEAIRSLVDNVNACDELWVVSDGAGKNIQSLGYEGDYLIMPNGVDIPRGRASEEEVRRVCGGEDLPEGVPVFLFVGRLKWYKGIRIILDALAALSSQGIDYRMVLIGSGGDEAEIRAYVSRLHLEAKCIFTGSIRERERLKAWYTRADLFLFPSTFDTNGLVVREAAACSLGTVLVRGSCAAEGVTHLTDGALIEENAASLAVCLARLVEHPEKMKAIGENACANLYLSWEDAVKKAMDRYEVVMDRYRCGKYEKKKQLSDGLFDLYGGLLEAYAQIEKLIDDAEARLREEKGFWE